MAGTRMQQRRDTAQQWAANNPVLADGELGWEKDTHLIKFGDGQTPWNQLPGMGYVTPDAVNAVLGAFGRDRGAGTDWPTAASSRRGDTYFHNAVAQLGIFNGAAWRLVDKGFVANTTALNLVSWAYPGMQVVMADSGLTMEYQNSFLGWTRPWNEAWGELQWSPLVTNSQPLTSVFAEYAWGMAPVPKGRKLRLRGQTFWYCGGTAVSLRGRLVVYRDATATPLTVAFTGTPHDVRIGGAFGDLAQMPFDTYFETTTQALGGSPNTKWQAQVCYVGGASSTSVYPVGGPEQNFIAIADVGPVGAVPTS